MIPSLQFSPPKAIIDGVELLRDALQRKLAQSLLTADDVHKIRVCCKKLRSWIRLLRHQHGAKHRQRADKALRKVVHKLALARDTTVLQQTVEKLQTSARSPHMRDACQQVLASMNTLAPAASAIRVKPLSDGIVKQLLSCGSPTHKILNEGLRVTYARCLRLAHGAFVDSQSSERLHRLRRWVKYLAYQLELIALPAQPCDGFREQLVTLGRILGEIHDLAALRQQLGLIETSGSAANGLVIAQAEQVERRLIRRAEILARNIFAC